MANIVCEGKKLLEVVRQILKGELNNLRATVASFQLDLNVIMLEIYFVPE